MAGLLSRLPSRRGRRVVGERTEAERAIRASEGIVSETAGGKLTTVDSPIGFLDVWVSESASGLQICACRSDSRQQYEGSLVSIAIARIVARLVVLQDVRLARHIEIGKAVRIGVHIAGANALNTPRPH